MTIYIYYIFGASTIIDNLSDSQKHYPQLSVCKELKIAHKPPVARNCKVTKITVVQACFPQKIAHIQTFFLSFSSSLPPPPPEHSPIVVTFTYTNVPTYTFQCHNVSNVCVFSIRDFQYNNTTVVRHIDFCIAHATRRCIQCV